MDMLPFNVLQHGATRTSRLARHTRHARHMFRGVATAWTGVDMSTVTGMGQGLDNS